MKSVSCKEISGLTCDFVSEAETAEEAKNGLLEHGMSKHLNLMVSLSEEDKKKMMDHVDEVLK